MNFWLARSNDSRKITNGADCSNSSANAIPKPRPVPGLLISATKPVSVVSIDVSRLGAEHDGCGVNGCVPGTHQTRIRSAPGARITNWIGGTMADEKDLGGATGAVPEEVEKCENCDKTATTHDPDGMPLCGQ